MTGRSSHEIDDATTAAWSAEIGGEVKSQSCRAVSSDPPISLFRALLKTSVLCSDGIFVAPVKVVLFRPGPPGVRDAREDGARGPAGAKPLWAGRRAASRAGGRRSSRRRSIQPAAPAQTTVSCTTLGAESPMGISSRRRRPSRYLRPPSSSPAPWLALCRARSRRRLID